MIELNDTTLDRLPPGVQRYCYDRTAVTPGILHFSVGNFHRAHQAWYIDRLLAFPGNEQWGLCGVGLLDNDTERLKTITFPRQDNLYTLTQYPPEGAPVHQVISAIVEYIFAPQARQAVLDRLTDPAIRIVTMTVTEGGYNLDRAGRYQLNAPAIAAELRAPDRPETAFGYIVEGLRRRRAGGIPPFTVLSCDNLLGNGAVARHAVLSHAGAVDGALADWIARRVAFPSSMVDRITPAVIKEDAERINAECGVRDDLPVYSESFAQWVVEDHFCNGRPPLELAGVQMVEDVRLHEMAKLRMLNGAHAVLAYPAQLAGLSTVTEALACAPIRQLLELFMERDVIVHLEPPPGMNLHDYKASLLARFSNPAIADQLPRLTADGAAKLPVYLGGTFADVLGAGADHRRLAFMLACFTRYLGGRDDLGRAFSPIEPHLARDDLALARDAEPRAALRMSMLAGFGIAEHGAFADCFVAMRAALARKGAMAVLEEMLAEDARAVPAAALSAD